jgi:hypothetical protein
MKTFNELTPRQQKQAIAYWLAEELKNIVEYGAYDVFLKEKN